MLDCIKKLFIIDITGAAHGPTKGDKNMKFKAKETLKNGLNETLFIKGNVYELGEVDNHYYWIISEIGLEVPFRIESTKYENPYHHIFEFVGTHFDEVTE